MGYRIQSGTECRLPYDRLIMACGSVLNRPDMVGIEHMFDVDKIDSAARLETHLKSLASLPDTPARNTVVVAGGGFTGIETATELPSRLRNILGEQARLRVVVVDRGVKIGAALGDGIRPAIEQACESLGIECLDLGAWGAVYTEGWERKVSPPTDKAEAKVLKLQINSIWIYPPAAEDRQAALAAADPTIPVA